jgi:hypothetical protein
MNHRDRTELIPLSQLPDYQVAEEDPDVRGWSVWDGDGGRIGRVRELLVDRAEGRVRLLAVGIEPGVPAEPDLVSHAGPGGSDPREGVDPVGLPLAAGLAGALGAMATPGMVGTAPLAEAVLAAGGGTERDVLIALRAARLDPVHRRLVVSGLRAADVDALPAWTGRPVEGATADELERRLGPVEVGEVGEVAEVVAQGR